MTIKRLFSILLMSVICACAPKLTKSEKDSKYYEFNEALLDYSEEAFVVDEGRFLQTSKESVIQPLMPHDYVGDLTEEQYKELKYARAVLMAIFANPYWSYEVNPKVSAAAQFFYDCWLENTAEGSSHGASKCQANFEKSIDFLMYKIASQQNFLSYAGSVNSVFFKFNSSKIEETSIAKLNLLIKQLKKVKDAELVLYGYTDRVGSKQINKSLGKARINSVIKVLEDSGVLKESNISLVTKDFGQNDPLISPQTVINNPHSRRVDIFIVSK